LAFVAQEDRVARAAALQAAAHALDFDLEPAVSQALFEPAVVPGRPDREDAADLERCARRRQPAVGIQTIVAGRTERRGTVVDVEQHRVEAIAARAENRADVADLDA